MTACMERTFRVQRLRVSLRGCGKWILHGKNSPNTNTTKFAINFDGKLDSFGIKRDCLFREGIFGAINIQILD